MTNAVEALLPDTHGPRDRAILEYAAQGHVRALPC
jgi:hypothetical protein